MGPRWLPARVYGKCVIHIFQGLNTLCIVSKVNPWVTVQLFGTEINGMKGQKIDNTVLSKVIKSLLRIYEEMGVIYVLLLFLAKLDRCDV